MTTTASLVLACQGVAFATSLSVSPVLIDQNVESGSTPVFPIKITNTDDDTLTVTFEHSDFGLDNETGAVRFIDDPGSETVKFSTRGWFSVPKEQYEIAPGETRSIPLQVAVPEGAEPGTYLGAAFFRSVGGTGGQIRTSARTGPLVFLRVDGGGQPQPRVTNIDVDSDGPGTRIRLSLDNQGAAHYSVQGLVHLNARGVSTKIEVPERFVLPGLERVIDLETDEELPFGRATVRLELETGSADGMLSGSYGFWIGPWWAYALIALGMVLIVGALVVTVVRHALRRQGPR